MSNYTLTKKEALRVLAVSEGNWLLLVVPVGAVKCIIAFTQNSSIQCRFYSALSAEVSTFKCFYTEYLIVDV